MEEILIKVIEQLSNSLDSEQLEKLRVALSTELKNYDIKPKVTAVVPFEDVNKQFLDGFMAWKIMEGKSHKTVKSYKYLLDRTLEVIQKSVLEITEYDIFIYLAKIQKDGASKSYAENYRRALQSFFSWMKSKEFIVKSPVDGISAIKKEKLIKQPFTDEEMEMLRNSCETLREKALIEVLYSCGVRVSELVDMNIKDVDFRNKECVVLGKGAKERKVYMSEKCIYLLKKYLKSRTDENEALFVTSRNPYTRIQPQAVRKLLKVIEDRSGVSNVHPHRFRRTLATNLLKKGMPIEEVSLILGHARLDTTMIYCSVSSEKLKTSYSTLMSA